MNILKITGPQHKYFRELFVPIGSHVQISGLKKILKDNKTVQRTIEESRKEVPETYIMAFAVVPEGKKVSEHKKDILNGLDSHYRKRKKVSYVTDELVEQYRAYLTYYIGKINKIDIDALRMGLELQSNVEPFKISNDNVDLFDNSEFKAPKIPIIKARENKMESKNEINKKKQVEITKDINKDAKNKKKKGILIKEVHSHVDVQDLFIIIKDGILKLSFKDEKGAIYLPPAPMIKGEMSTKHFGKIILE